MSRAYIASVLGAILIGSGSAIADPECAGPDHWAAIMTFAQLKNSGVLTNDSVDFTRTKSDQIASEKIARDLYRQVFKVTFYLKDGRTVRAIAVSDASSGGCSMSDVTVYRIAEPLR
jgi:hypothetical protein